MSAATARRTEPAPTVGAVGADPTLALARVEALRLLRHPAFVAGALGSILAVRNGLAIDPLETWSGADYWATFVGWFPLWLGTLVAAALGAGRGRLAADADLFPGVPTTARTRVLAHVVALAAPVAVAVVATSVVAVGVARDGGFRQGDGPYAELVVPPVTEWAQVPLLVLLAGVVGIAVANLPRWRLGALLSVSLVTFLTTAAHWIVEGTRLRALHPLMAVASERRLPDDFRPTEWVAGDPPLRRPDEYARFWRQVDFDTTAMALHLVYLVGIVVAVVLLAMRVADDDGRRPPLRLGAVLVPTVVTGVLQVLLAGPR